MSQIVLDYMKVLNLIPAGKNWSDIAEAMGKHRSSGTRYANIIREGKGLTDITARDFAIALGKLRDEPIQLTDIMATEPAAK